MEQPNKDTNQGKIESPASETGDIKSTRAVQPAKISFWNYVAFSAIGFIALGPLSYLLADRNEWYVLLPAALFVAA